VRLRWGRWLTRWATLKKRIPAILAGVGVFGSALADPSVIAAVPAKYTPLRLMLGAVCTVVLMVARSVKTGSHGEDYVVGLVADRRGSGTRTGEMKAATDTDAPASDSSVPPTGEHFTGLGVAPAARNITHPDTDEHGLPPATPDAGDEGT
jgi:hypothetical protein